MQQHLQDFFPAWGEQPIALDQKVHALPPTTAGSLHSIFNRWVQGKRYSANVVSLAFFSISVVRNPLIPFAFGIDHGRRLPVTLNSEVSVLWLGVNKSSSLILP